MAIWQFDLYFLPEVAVKRIAGEIPDRLSQEELNRIILWKTKYFPAHHATCFDELLPEIPSWSPNIRWWGSEEGDRIDVDYKSGKIACILLRLDLRRINTRLAQGMVDIAREWKCVLLSAESGKLLRPTRSALMRHLTESRTFSTAWSWVGGKFYEFSNLQPKQVFLCHSSKDKRFVRKLANDLQSFGVPVWYDEWALRVGDSLNDKIQQGLAESGWLVVVLSKNSVGSSWVRRELNAALALELEQKQVYVLPVRIDSCRMPVLLKDRLYADFRNSYDDGLQKLLRRFRGE